MPDELTKALLLEEVASAEAVAEALFVSVTGGVPLVAALTEPGGVSPDLLARYLARSQAPYLRQVAAVAELVERLPPGLCTRLLAVPVRRDAITGTVDVVVADASDGHPAREIAFHLGAPVRVVRASRAAIEEALRRLGPHSLPAPARPAPAMTQANARDDDRIYDSRPRPRSSLDAQASEALRPSRVPLSDYQAHVVPGGTGQSRRSSATPPWGTPVHNARSSVKSDPPRSGLGSEIPIPLTRRTFTAVSGGTQRPPPLVDPSESLLGEGYPVDPAHFRQIVEVNEHRRPPSAPEILLQEKKPGSPRIPGPPPVPRTSFASGGSGGHATQAPSADIGGILATLRAAGSRDEVLELVLTGARLVALKVALFVVKRGGYLGWACTPELGDRAALQTILIPVESPSIFENAARDGLYLGPLRRDDVHAGLLHVMGGASRDVVAVPIRVSGKTAVMVLADELGDTMLATRRLEELAHAAGEAFARIVRMRR